MRFRGGYNVMLEGRPAANVEVPPDPAAPYIPLSSRRFTFSQIAAEEGQQGRPGRVPAKDPANHHVPLLTPRAGQVRLAAVEGHIVLEDAAREGEEPYNPKEDEPRAREENRPHPSPHQSNANLEDRAVRAARQTGHARRQGMCARLLTALDGGLEYHVAVVDILR
jgi:hypothetical protein